MGTYISKFKWTNKGTSPRKDVWFVCLLFSAVDFAADFFLSFFEWFREDFALKSNIVNTNADFASMIVSLPLGISLFFLYARRYREIEGDPLILERIPKWKHGLIILSVIFLNKISFGIIPLLWFGLKRSKIDDSDEYNELPNFAIIALVALFIISFGTGTYQERIKEKDKFIASSTAYKHETYKIYTDKMTEYDFEKFSSTEIECREKGISFEQRKNCMNRIINNFDYYLVKVNTDSLYLNAKYRENYDNKTRFLMDYGNLYHITQMDDYTTFIIDYWEVIEIDKKIKAMLKDKIKISI
jgi:hypothetical protein